MRHPPWLKVSAPGGGTLLNLDRALLVSQPFAEGWNSLFSKVRTGLSLDPKLRELAICAVAVLNRAPYELAQHIPEFLAVGGTQAQLNALNDSEAGWNDENRFEASERAVLALTREMTLTVQVSDTCYEFLRQALPDPQQQVEIVGVIASYNMVSRFLEALRIPLD